MIWIELRRSMMRWGLPIVLTAGGALAWAWSDTWQVWPEVSATTAFAATRFAVAILAGAAAWSAQRDRRAGLRAQLDATARRPWQVESVHLLGTLIYAWAGLLLIAVVIELVVIARIGPGFLWPSYLLLALTSLTFSVAVGHLVGRLTTFRFAAPLVGLVMLVLGFVAPPNAPFELSVVTGPAKLVLSPGVMAARSVFAAVCLLLAVTLPSRVAAARRARESGRRGESRWQTTSVVLAAVATLAWLVFAGPLQMPRAPVADPVCGQVSAGPRVCLWPENRAYLDEALLAATALRKAAGETVPLPAVFYDEGLRDGPSFTALAVTKPMIADMAIAAMPSFRGCTDGSQTEVEQRLTAAGRIWVWLAARSNGLRSVGDEPSFMLPPEVSTEVDAALTRPEPAQRVWIKEQLATAKAGCRA
ncbi:hypothetical protein ABT294_08090 [Nonomuraea sp. NPDC000554]|uniref:DUF7224 domain-containing protein n=1 Tax=Nonomuraea sp. NPDC000554 TaxID=3154259 RepID=UPI0033170D2E